MTIAELGLLTDKVLWAAFLLSMVFGAVVQRSGFCTMGAVSDAVALGDFTRLRQWALAAGVAIVGFGLLAWSGQIDPARTLYGGPRWLWLSGAAGGFIFGFGMVLSSGCPSKTLVRLGAGSLKALVVTLVVGISAFATLKGVTAVWRTATVDRLAVEFQTGATLPAWTAQALSLQSSTAHLLAALLVGGVLLAWVFHRREFLHRNNLLAGLGVGGVVVAMWWVSGHLGFVAEHPETLEDTVIATNSARIEALSFVSPVAYTLDWLMFYSDRNKLVTVGIVSVFGVIMGSAAVALVQRSFRWEGFAGQRDLGQHLVGGLLMGVGGVTAMGCSIGQGVSGVSALSAQSFLAVLAMLAGAAAAVNYQVLRLESAP